jgi:hypothetical protein
MLLPAQRARLGVIVVAAVAIAALAAGRGARAEAQPFRVLFVGNSLTATNDLPAVVAGLARARARTLEYRTIAFGGYALEDHWARGDARAALASRSWDIVVLQQGPSALPESQINLREWASRFADEARAAGTRPALLTVWPESYRRGALRDVIASYRRAAAAARADLFPAGLAWRIAWGCRPGLALYGPRRVPSQRTRHLRRRTRALRSALQSAPRRHPRTDSGAGCAANRAPTGEGSREGSGPPDPTAMLVAAEPRRKLRSCVCWCGSGWPSSPTRSRC